MNVFIYFRNIYFYLTFNILKYYTYKSLVYLYIFFVTINFFVFLTFKTKKHSTIYTYTVNVHICIYIFCLVCFVHLLCLFNIFVKFFQFIFCVGGWDFKIKNYQIWNLKKMRNQKSHFSNKISIFEIRKKIKR